MSADSRIRRALDQKTPVDRLLRRIRCQIEFGRAIDEGRFTAALDGAEAVYGSAGSHKTYAELQQAVAKAEQALAPVAQEAKTFTIHLIGHGHIDMNWMWSWPETCATTHDTFASVLALMEEYPELTYTQSQASVYALVEKYHPAMFEQIKQRVREDRWEVAAVQWVEGDKNLASGESLARHLLYTRRYFEDKFGLSPEDIQLDWEPDTFGHCNTLPGILRQGGVKYYYCCRPGGGQEHLRVGEPRPPLFWWQSPDGSRVLVNRETTWYNSYVEIGDNFALPAAAFFRATGLKDWMNVYGIGNHGGGPTRSELDFFLETRDWPCWPTVIFGKAQDWFRKIEPLCADLPVIDHELNYEFTGCYTSQSAIKKANRYGESYCLEAETLAAIVDCGLPIVDSSTAATSGDKPDARSTIREAWLNILFNQFHDILPGSGVQETRQHALGLFQESAAISGAIKRNALQALANDLNTAALLPDTPEGHEERELLSPLPFARSGGGRGLGDGGYGRNTEHLNQPFEAGAGQGAGESGLSRASGGGHRFRPVMIYNPCAWQRTELVEINLYDLPEDLPTGSMVAIDEHGATQPTLDITSISGGNHDWGHRRATLLFEAKDIPPLGYRVFLFCEGETQADRSVTTVDEVTFRTPTLEVKCDKFRGGVSSARFGSAELHGLGKFECVTEWPTGMSAWLLGGNTGREAFLKDNQDLESWRFWSIGNRANMATSLRSGSCFAVVAGNRLKVPGTKSRVDQRMTLSASQSRIDFQAEIDWREIGSEEDGIPGLQIAFQLPDSKSAIFETAYGSVTRSCQGQEVPTLRYAHDPQSRITILQDSKYAHCAGSGNLNLRVLRSTYEPDQAPEVAKSTMRYAVVFHDEAPTTADLARLGAAFNHPLIAVPVLLQQGSAPTTQSFLQMNSATPNSVVLAHIKAAEDGQGLILRFVNYADKVAEAAVTLDKAIAGSYKAAATVDLMERPCEGQASLAGLELKAQVKPNSFTTVRLS